jgi:UDP-N-acetyl-D-mannosaminuronic acid dehydrogenase
MTQTQTSCGEYDICVVGGAGHVGAPLSIVLALMGFRTLVYDLNPKALELLQTGNLPFMEDGGEKMLREVLPTKRLGFTSDLSCVRGVPNLILTIGTPIDEFHNPVRSVVTDCVGGLFPYLDGTRLLILRSTVSPGTTDELDRFLKRNGKDIAVAFCPERVVQGNAIKEIQTMPQIVSGTTPEAEEMAAEIFQRIAPKIVRIRPMEAEFTKLICNAYRYIQFAATNQFYMMVESAGCNYNAVVRAVKDDYLRMRDFPGPGFAAGPCLHKDMLQIAAFAQGQFELGHAAIHVNEGLPAYLVSRLEREYPLDRMRVGLLGMAFKAESDDVRSSLSYKLKKLLKHVALEVLCTDPYVRDDPSLVPLEEVLEGGELLIIAAPHRIYSGIKTGKPVIDIWSLRK